MYILNLNNEHLSFNLIYVRLFDKKNTSLAIDTTGVTNFFGSSVNILKIKFQKYF